MSESQLSQYDELAIRHRAAFAAFSSIYEDKNPPPKPTPVEADSLFVPIALVVMIIASVFVSGSRTIVEFGGGFVGIMAFLMLEGAIVAYAFYRTRRNFTEERLETVRKMANFGLGLAFTVAVAANIHSVLKEKGVQVADGVNTIILIMVGVSAPTLAFISGDIMAVESKANSVKARKAKEVDDANMTVYLEGKNAAWAREKSKWGVKVEVENMPQPRLEAENTVNSRILQSNTRFTPSRKLQLALDWFESNPGHLAEESRKLAEIIGVSHTTVNKAQRMLRNEDNS